MTSRTVSLVRPNAARTTRRGGRLVSLTLVLVALLGTATDLQAHLALAGSSPSAGDTLTEAPREIVLTFTEDIDLPLSRLTLVGPGGAIGIGAVSSSGTGMRAALPDGLLSGGYRVEWQAVGRDGHPVRGSFDFELASGAADGLPAAGTGPVMGASSSSDEAPGSPVGGATGASSGVSSGVSSPGAPSGSPPDPATASAGSVTQPDTSFAAQSPLYALVRWLNYLGIIASIGSVVFLMLLRRTGGTSHSHQFIDSASRSAAGLGLAATGLLAISIVLRLEAQSHAILGSGLSRTNFGILMSSDWGAALTVQIVATSVLALGIALTLRSARIGLWTAAIAAVALTSSVALSSHAAAAPEFRTLAIAADSLHILAASVWLGTLLVFVVSGVPHLRRLDAADRAIAYRKLLRDFSSVALVSGGVLVMTGAFAANLQLTGPGDLLNTRYGAVFAAKLILAIGVFALGALNWRRLPGKQQEPGAVDSFRRRATLELGIALLVVAATAMLVAIPPPSHESAIATMTADPAPAE